MAVMEKTRRGGIEVVKEVVKMVKVQRTGQGLYSGDDRIGGKLSLNVRQGAEAVVSLEKAMQLVRDFPEDWNILDTPDEESRDRLIKALAEGQVRTQKLRTSQSARRTAAAESMQKIVKRTPSDDFVNALNGGRIKVQEITTKELLDTVKHPGYLGVNAYAYALKDRIENEIGGNHMSNVRYSLVKVKKVTETLPSKKQEKKGKGKKVEEFGETEESVTEPVQSRDFDVDDIPGAKFDDPETD